MAVTCDDFVDAMQEASGKDLSQFRRWYEQAGTPVIAVETKFDAVSGKFDISFEQRNPPTPGQAPSHRFIYLWLCRYWSMGSITTLAKARKSVLWSSLKLLRRSVSMGCPNNRCSLCCEVSLHLFAWSSSNQATSLWHL